MALSGWCYVFSYDMFGAPDDSAFIVPKGCPTQISQFSQGVPVLYWNHDTGYRGYGSIKLEWRYQDEPAFKAFRQDWKNSFQAASYGGPVSKGRLWFNRYNPETDGWEYTSGAVVDITQQDFSGVLAQNYTVTIGRLNLHKNVHPAEGTVKDPMGYIDAGHTFRWGGGDFQNNQWSGI